MLGKLSNYRLLTAFEGTHFIPLNNSTAEPAHSDLIEIGASFHQDFVMGLLFANIIFFISASRAVRNRYWNCRHLVKKIWSKGWLFFEGSTERNFPQDESRSIKRKLISWRDIPVIISGGFSLKKTIFTWENRRIFTRRMRETDIHVEFRGTFLP